MINSGLRKYLKFYLLISGISFAMAVQAQEVLRGLSVNPYLIKNTSVTKLKSTSSDSQLPFADDFSTTTGYPNSKCWVDSMAYINTKYAIGPPSTGVATLDVLDKNRNVYPHSGIKHFIADTLTSKSIDLSSASNVYLSFFYQAQGAGYAPGSSDSLILELFDSGTSKWVQSWSAKGQAVQKFQEVLLKVDDGYCHSGFRFRFRNFASMDNADTIHAEYVDLWHIDNVRLDKNRNAADFLTWCINAPILDDFSTTTAYPDSKIWTDKQAYINSTYPVNPPSIGVATLDAMDENGRIYEGASYTPFYADKLTVKPIDFSANNESDSIYLSFFYQPQGLGDAPDTGDSLMVEFYNPTVADSIAWTKVWAVPGDSVYDFRQAMIPVKAPYVQKGFQFRFQNIASLSANMDEPGKRGNVDQWHIDYVRLNAGRNINDTQIKDVAFVKPLGSMLKSYQAMPWNQFSVAFRVVLKPFFSITYKNNDDVDLKVTRSFELKDLYAGTVDKSSAGEENVRAGQTFVLDSIPIDPFNTAFTDTAKFELKSYLSTTNPNDNKNNDTLRFNQIFRNYYAYDDGTSESGYGLQGQGTQDGMVAYGFTAYTPDTVKAISIYFNPTANDTSSSFIFKLRVWADNKGVPGKILYDEYNEDFTPKLVKNNQFYNYILAEGVPVSDKFYVGWVQTQESYMNVGFDLNNNNQQNLFFNISGGWEHSQMKGSLMLRPIVHFVEKTVLAVKTISTTAFRVYPNPASDYITMDGGSESEKAKSISIFSISGKTMLNKTTSDNTIDVRNLPNGLYILKINSTVQKILIQR
jgi:hypothetical protein